MQKIAAAMAYLAIESRQLPFGPMAAMTPQFAPGNLLMRGLDLLFALAIEAGALHGGTIREDGKGGDPQVNADFLFAGMEGL